MSESTPPAAGAAPAAAPPRKKRGPLFTLVLLLLLGGGLAWSAHFVMRAISTEETDDAYIAGHVHRIGAGVAGTLLEVKVDDNQEVKCGQLLAKIDPLEFEIMEKQAVAALEQAKGRELQAKAKAAEARSAELQSAAEIAMAEAAIRQQNATLELARITLRRSESLLRGETRAVPQAEVDQARSAAESAEAMLAHDQAKLASAQAGKEAATATSQAAEADIVSARADIDARQATIREARRQRDLTDVLAPADGRIGNRNAETGNRVQVGQSLYALVEEDYWIVGNFKETQLKKMRVGQPVDISIDALGGRHFSGRIDSIAPSTGAQFALLPPDNATGNFTKVVQRVPVKITFDPASIRDALQALRPGLSTVVRVSLK